MKKIFFCIIIFIAAKTLPAENTLKLNIPLKNTYTLIDTTTYPIASLSGVTWSFYVNRPINTLLLELNDLFPGYKLGRVYPKDRLSMAGRINVYYGGGIALILTVSKFQFLNPTSHDAAWDINLFRRENISQIELWDNTVCVYNSNP